MATLEQDPQARSERNDARPRARGRKTPDQPPVEARGIEAAATTDADTDADAPSADELRQIDAWWRASTFLAAGMIYLLDNPLLREPLAPAHIKPRLLGHWGSSPGLSFMYTHLNRAIRRYDLDAIFIAGPGHGAPGVLGPAWLEGTYGEVYPEKGYGLEGLRRFFRDFSFPGGVGSHCTPETPGSIHEGGELGYSLSHAFGAAFDNPELLVAVAIGDGEAETGPLATAWHSNKFLNPARDGAVLPILHLNGWKIDNPALLARIGSDELDALLRGYGWIPYYVEGGADVMAMHARMAVVLERCVRGIRAIQRAAREGGGPNGGSDAMRDHGADWSAQPRWPMIVLRSPKGWTGPKEIDGRPVEGSWRSHQVPLADVSTDPARLAQLEHWLRSYRPEELFDAEGCPLAALREYAPRGTRRMSANPHANGGLLRRPLRLSELREHAVEVGAPGRSRAGNTRPLAALLRDVLRLNPHNFRIFGPDETTSNRLGLVYEASGKTWMADLIDADHEGSHLARDGRVMEMLSEHTVEGWLEGYLLTGRHGFLSSYEAFVHVIDSMFNQHAKWLDACEEIPWRAPIASLNLLITSTVWRQDHNGFTHQDPGFIDLVANKSPQITRIWLPPDANCLLAVAARCLRSTNRVNVIVCDKQQHLQYLDIDAAIRHVEKGASLWHWASSDEGREPDVVMASCGDVATQEALAAVALLREGLPDLRVRFVNVVDLYAMTPRSEHPHGLSDRDFDGLFTTDRPIIFNFHGYPWLVHRLAYRRTNHRNLHVRGYKEKGSINTPLELAIANDIDRYSLAIDAIDRVPRVRGVAAHFKERLRDQKLEALEHAHRAGIDREEIRDWLWPDGSQDARGRDRSGWGSRPPPGGEGAPWLDLGHGRNV